MPSIYDLAVLAGAAYNSPPGLTEGWHCTHFKAGDGVWDGLQAATFTKNGETVLAFRGTAIAKDQKMTALNDVLADLQLGMGGNTTHFSAAEQYAALYANTPNLTLCGHSLGGAIAQIVGNRREIPFATYNAPGVAVLASKNIGSTTRLMLGVRIVGSLVSAVRHPMQAARDVKAVFNKVTGVNICLQQDPVSKMGIHYGNVIKIPGTSQPFYEQHSIDVLIGVLKNHPFRNMSVQDLAG